MTPRQILLLGKLPIGDSLLVEPTVRALRMRYPRANLTALTGSNAAPVWDSVPAIDDVVVLPVGTDWSGPRRLTRTLLNIRTRHFDVAINFTSPAYKWVSLIGGIPRRTYMKFDRLWWVIPRRHDRWRATHATRHYYDCARELDLPEWDSFDHVPRLCLPESAYAEAAALLRLRRVDRARPLIGIHAGGAALSGIKRWPPDRFAAIAKQLCEQLGARIVLLGGPEDRDVSNQISSGLRNCVVDGVGRLSLLVSFALIAACDLFVGNDSCLLHAAAALGTPYVGVIGPTSPASFRPIPSRPGQGRLVQADPPCVEQKSFVGDTVIWERPRCTRTCAALAVLSPERVLAAALQQLGHGPTDVRAMALSRR